MPGVVPVRYQFTWRYFTPEQLDAAVKAWGLDRECRDEDTLRGAAAVEAAARARITREAVAVPEGRDGDPPPAA
jgi:hypothetical protein